MTEQKSITVSDEIYEAIKAAEQVLWENHVLPQNVQYWDYATQRVIYLERTEAGEWVEKKVIVAKDVKSFLQLMYSLARQLVTWYEKEIKNKV